MTIYSFDIFDTCLFRSCGKPSYVFDILGSRVLGTSLTDNKTFDFSLLRQHGEGLAHNKKNYEEVTLEEIYECCDFSHYTSLDKKEIMRLEMEIEESVLFPIEKTKERITNLRSKGHQICFISDMYLPYDFILKILLNTGLFKEGDKLYLSSKERVTKRRGHLYDYVLNDLKIKPYQLVHTGDNRRSDLYIPLKKGIRVHLFQKNFTIKNDHLIDFNYNISDILNTIQNGMNKRKELPVREFAINLIAPLFVPLTYKILDYATKNGYTKLFFLARDSYILYLIAHELNSLFPNLELKYLYVSRKSLYFPCFPPFEQNNKESIINCLHKYNYNQIKDFLHLDDLGINDFDKSQPNARTLIEGIFNRGHNFTLELERQKQLKLTLDYFIQEGLASHEHHNLVIDLRSTLSSIEDINKILKVGYYKSISVFLLEVLKYRNIKHLSCDYISVLNDHRYLNFPYLSSISKADELLEQYYGMSPHLRTKGYRLVGGKIVPLFENNKFDENSSYKNLYFSINKEVSLSFAKIFKNSQILNVFCNELIKIGIDNLIRFIQNPDYKYLKFLNNVIVSENAITAHPLVKKITWNDRKDFNSRWGRGSFILTFGPLGKPLFKIMRYYYLLKNN